MNSIKSINISTVSKILFLTAIVTVILHFTMHPVRVLDMQTSIFYMDEEFTIAALLTSAFAFYAGILALDYYLLRRKVVNLIWSGIFFALALDEYFSIHEYLNGLFKRYLDETSILSNLASVSWIFTLGVIFLAIAVFILYWTVKEQNKAARLMLFLGMASYVTVLIIELIGGQTYGRDIYLVFVGIEEGLEMVGTIFFIEAFRQKLKLNET